MGHVGELPFYLGFLSSVAVMALIGKLNFRGSLHFDNFITKNLLIPAGLVHLFFLIGYHTSLIPPVPVAVKKIGLYYEVTKENGNYYGKHLRPWWNVWNAGEQEFYARPGDKVVVMLSIFSPAEFKDRVNLRWYYQRHEGMRLEDTIPLTILGGREAGFRGYGSKQFYSPGHWKVVVETSDGREVGRIKFKIKTDDLKLPRTFLTDVY